MFYAQQLIEVNPDRAKAFFAFLPFFCCNLLQFEIINLHLQCNKEEIAIFQVYLQLQQKLIIQFMNTIYNSFYFFYFYFFMVNHEG